MAIPATLRECLATCCTSRDRVGISNFWRIYSRRQWPKSKVQGYCGEALCWCTVKKSLNGRSCEKGAELLGRRWRNFYFDSARHIRDKWRIAPRRHRSLRDSRSASFSRAPHGTYILFHECNERNGASANYLRPVF